MTILTGVLVFGLCGRSSEGLRPTLLQERAVDPEGVGQRRQFEFLQLRVALHAAVGRTRLPPVNHARELGG